MTLVPNKCVLSGMPRPIYLMSPEQSPFYALMKHLLNKPTTISIKWVEDELVPMGKV